MTGSRLSEQSDWKLMKFVIIGYDGEEGEAKRKIHRSAHLANLELLHKQGRVVLAGPLTDKTGSLLVLEFDTQEEAEEFARHDPYTVHGVFERFEIHPFMQVLPNQPH
jgi:uncharacterized protein